MHGADGVPSQGAVGSAAKHEGAVEGVVHGVGIARQVEGIAIGFDHVDKAGAEAQERAFDEDLGLWIVAGADGDGAVGVESIARYEIIGDGADAG